MRTTAELERRLAVESKQTSSLTSDLEVLSSLNNINHQTNIYTGLNDLQV